MCLNRLLALTLGVLLIGLTMPGYSETVGKSIATVNGEAIYSVEFENNYEALLEQQKKVGPEALPPEWAKNSKRLLLDQMIEEKLLIQEANRRKIVVPKRQFEEGVLQVKNRFKNIAPGAKPTKEDYERDLTAAEKKEFTEELKQQNISEKEFEEKINDQMKVLRLTEEEVRAKVAIPVREDKSDSNAEPKELTSDYDKEARTLFAEIEKKFSQKDFKPHPENETDQIVEILKSKLGESVHARHILIKSNRSEDFKKRQAALVKAQGIKKELDGGADFTDLANQKSEGPSSKNGGDLGFFTRGQMTPEFEKAAFALPVGGISDVVETEFGYHIIQIEEKKAAKRLRYDDVKLDLGSYIYQKRMKDRYEQFVDNLRKKADVKILVDLEKNKG